MVKDIILRPMHPDVEAKLENEFDWDPSRPLAEQWPWSSPISNRPHDLAPDPMPDWQQKVLAECDRIDEQRRHAVAASVARHAEMNEPEPRMQLVIGLLKMSNPSDPGHPKLCEQLCKILKSETNTLDGIDQSTPDAAPDAPPN